MHCVILVRTLLPLRFSTTYVLAFYLSDDMIATIFFCQRKIQFFACFFFLPEIEMRASRECLSDELACAVVYMYHGKACAAYKSPLRHSLHRQRGKTMNGKGVTNDRREKES